MFEVLYFGMELFFLVFSENFLDFGELLGESNGPSFAMGFCSEINGFGVHEVQ